MGDSEKGSAGGCADNLMWWTTLLVAVLAIPSIAITVTMIFNVQGIAEVLVFVITCWISTYLGMRLMMSSNNSSKE